MPNEQLQLQVVRPGICYGALRDVLLLYYRTSPTLEDLRSRAGLVAETLRNHERGVAFLSVIDAPLGVAFPDSETRAETQRQLQSAKSFLRGGAVVLTGSSVRVSLTKMLLSRLPGMARGKTQMRFFSETEEAARWCLVQLHTRRTEREARVRELVEGVARMGEEAGHPDR